MGQIDRTQVQTAFVTQEPLTARGKALILGLFLSFLPAIYLVSEWSDLAARPYGAVSLGVLASAPLASILAAATWRALPWLAFVLLLAGAVVYGFYGGKLLIGGIVFLVTLPIGAAFLAVAYGMLRLAFACLGGDDDEGRS